MVILVLNFSKEGTIMKVDISTKSERCLERCQDMAAAMEKEGKSPDDRSRRYHECVMLCNLEDTD